MASCVVRSASTFMLVKLSGVLDMVFAFSDVNNACNPFIYPCCDREIRLRYKGDSAKILG